jgi:hypothetical protein
MRRLALCTALALTATTAASWAVVPKHDTYEGKTGQNRKVFVKVNDKGRIKAFLISYSAKCNQGSHYSGSIEDDDKKGDRITQQNGVFSGDSAKNESAGGGYTGHVKLNYDGKFTTKTAANGEATIHVKVKQGSSTVAKCSKTVKWHVPE